MALWPNAQANNMADRHCVAAKRRHQQNRIGGGACSRNSLLAFYSLLDFRGR